MLAGILGDDNDVGARLKTIGTEPDQLVDRIKETSIAGRWSIQILLVNDGVNLGRADF
jgi:hypothetical protein